jgi:hypothetical protein
VKLNDVFEFPFSLRIPSEFVYQEDEKSSVTDSEIERYELVGVLIHRGEAERGHNYSFIQDQLPSSSSCNTTPALYLTWF